LPRRAIISSARNSFPSEKRNGDPASRRIAAHCSEMSIARLSAIQLRRQVARHFHARLGLVNRRLLPLKHLKLSFSSFTLASPIVCKIGFPALPFCLGISHDNFKSYFLIE
jgi:hypothetical protein